MSMTVGERREIAETILAQLGGNKFTVMTGAKNYIIGEDGSLQFRIPRAKDGINLVSVKLNSLDLYDVEFRRFTMSKTYEAKNTLKHEAKGIYCDQLRGVFERATGLRTSLTEVYA